MPTAGPEMLGAACCFPERCWDPCPAGMECKLCAHEIALRMGVADQCVPFTAFPCGAGCLGSNEEVIWIKCLTFHQICTVSRRRWAPRRVAVPHGVSGGATDRMSALTIMEHYGSGESADIQPWARHEGVQRRGVPLVGRMLPPEQYESNGAQY